MYEKLTSTNEFRDVAIVLKDGADRKPVAA
jgi:hypothetical protein